MPAGRPTKYKKKFCGQMIAYFDAERTKTILEKFYYKNGDTKEKEIEVANELPTIQGFCKKIHINKSTLHEWVGKYKEFSDAYKEAKSMQEEFWLQNSIRGLYPAQFTIFAGKNIFGWKDRVDTDITSKGEAISPILVKFLDVERKDDRDTNRV